MAQTHKKISETRLGITLQRIAVDIVEALGYVGAMIAVLEEGGTLPVYAFYVKPDLATLAQIKRWEGRISKVLNKPVALSDPELARVYVNDSQYKGNLSVQAVKQKKPIISDDLFTLFTPIVPANALTKPIINNVIQPALGIKQVIAVPFFLEPPHGGEPEIVGNLFAARHTEITPENMRVLTSFGRHAAAAIEIEHRRVQILQVARQLTTEIQTRIRQEDAVLQQIAEGVVNVLGYVGAMVATYEQDDALSVRAFYIDPKLATLEQIKIWEERLSRLIGRPVSISDPEVAKVYINGEGYEENLSVQAVKQKQPVVHHELSTLFAPIVPSNRLTRPIVNKVIQGALQIKQVIAVPFFLQASDGDDPQIVGNLFAATTHPAGFQKEEIDLLRAFGQQAAAGIFNAQLYRQINEAYNMADEQRQVAEKQRGEIEELYQKSEERRAIAEVLGKMAFSASKSVHQFRNHIGFIRGQLQLLPYIDQFPEEQRQEIIQSTPNTIKRLDIIAELLNQLHEPWRPVDNKPTDVNTCLINAKDQDIPTHATGTIQIDLRITDNLPLISTSPDMLTEAFSILLKNGVEAIRAKGCGDGRLRIESTLQEGSLIKVQIEDNGFGIQAENLDKIFQLRWSTKESGLGFGLFWAKDYIEGLGGKIEVASVWQTGTTFSIHLPAT